MKHVPPFFSWQLLKKEHSKVLKMSRGKKLNECEIHILKLKKEKYTVTQVIYSKIS